MLLGVLPKVLLWSNVQQQVAQETERQALREREREALRERDREMERAASAHLAETGDAGGKPST